MNRKEFMRMCGLLGVGWPILSSYTCFSRQKRDPQFHKVIVVGAGAAGLTAGYLLRQQGIEVEILEAGPVYGGRMKRTNTFADFPIPLGAEWLHTKKSVLNKIVNDPKVHVDIVTKPYDFDGDHALVDGKKRNLKALGFTIDQKFINSTWFDFFEQYVVPAIKDTIHMGTVVKSIDYTTGDILLETSNGPYRADKVIITVPVKILQDKSIRFIPELPQGKLEAIKNTTVWGGCKAFIKFSKKFYPTVVGFDNMTETVGHKLYYDASYGQDTSDHILGLFAVGSVADPYLKRKKNVRIEYILSELDGIFDGQATPNYREHIFQNWTEEPHVKGAYVHYFEDWRTLRTLAKSVGHKLYFAGDAYTDGNEWSSVHAAALSARKAVKAIMG
ncbi:MAG: flavin monoamine oxidase family protein [Flavobacteriaceae bacterium]